MMYRQLQPVEEKHTNRIFTGAGEVKDLPATVYTMLGQRAVASHYRLSLLERFVFLFSGKIYVSILSDAIPPMAVGIGELFERG